MLENLIKNNAVVLRMQTTVIKTAQDYYTNEGVH